jgi:hypothetical protein
MEGFLRSKQKDSEVEIRVCVTERTEVSLPKKGVSTVGRKDFQQPEEKSFCS